MRLLWEWTSCRRCKLVSWLRIWSTQSTYVATVHAWYSSLIGVLKEQQASNQLACKEKAQLLVDPWKWNWLDTVNQALVYPYVSSWMVFRCFCCSWLSKHSSTITYSVSSTIRRLNCTQTLPFRDISLLAQSLSELTDHITVCISCEWYWLSCSL